MTQTKYPISKIRSGEVAVRLTDIEQFKKIATEDKDYDRAFIKDYYHAYQKYNGIKNPRFVYQAQYELDKYTKIDFQQIDWEEGKDIQYGTIITKEELKKAEVIGTESTEIESLRNQLATLKAENERLKEDKKKLQKEVTDYKLSINLYGLGNSSIPSQNQELSLKQRMAWELWKAGGITLEQAYQDVDNFLNYKGGDDEQ